MARPGTAPAARLARPRRTRPHRHRPARPDAARLRRRGGEPAHPDGQGRRGGGLRAAGRGLRRDLRGQHRGPGAQQDAHAAADGGGAHLRGGHAGGEDRPDGRPVREAPQRRRRGARRHHAAQLPRGRGQHPRVHRRGAPPGPGADAGDVPPLRGHPQPHARLLRRWLRGPSPGAAVEPRLHGEPGLRALRGRGRPHRRGAEFHAGRRRGLRRHQERGPVRRPRGAAHGLRGGAHPHRLAHGLGGRRCGR